MRERIPWKRILTLLALALLATVIYLFWPNWLDLTDLADAGAGYNVRILRDTWGVPHIYGETDADVGYGLAYAHAEDDFGTIQQSLLAARGQLAAVYGRDAVINDYFVHSLRIWDVIEARYDTLMPETRALLEAYADGLNHYAGLHANQVLAPGLFPVSGKDIVAGSMHKAPSFFGLEKTLAELFEEERQQGVSAYPPLNPPPIWGGKQGVDSNAFSVGPPTPPSIPPQFGGGEEAVGSNTFSVGPLTPPSIPPQSGGGKQGVGSNTFSVGPARTPDGATYLAVNAHQPWEGPVAWYEAHLHSQEGWDMTGALFPGVPLIIHGHNRDLGWAFTVNAPDLVDVYVLEINPENPNQYRFDGQWLDLEVRTVPITVKLLGRLKWTVNQEALWSIHGPVIRRDHGTYALRYAGMGRVDIYEQLYRMNKATTFQEWQAALQGGGLPSFNIGYADREGNIYYLYNGLIPQRAQGYDWSLYLPGDTSETLWNSYLPLERLPQVLNPPSGFVQNANSTPFRTTVGPGNPDPEDYPPSLGIEDGMTNRALRALELFGADESITFEEFERYKYDVVYADGSDVARYREMILSAPAPVDPDLQAALEILRDWDLQANPENTGTALMVLTLYYLHETEAGIKPSALVGHATTLSQLLESVSKAVETLMDGFGRIDVPWSEVNRLRRGDLDLGLGGGPDLLHAVYGELREDGRLEGYVGDGYVLLVRWDAAGRVESYSVHQYGSATLDEKSPHYADQAPLFARQELKPVWFDEAEIRANLEREYRPGTELK